MWFISVIITLVILVIILSVFLALEIRLRRCHHGIEYKETTDDLIQKLKEDVQFEQSQYNETNIYEVIYMIDMTLYEHKQLLIPYLLPYVIQRLRALQTSLHGKHKVTIHVFSPQKDVVDCIEELIHNKYVKWVTRYKPVEIIQQILLTDIWTDKSTTPFIDFVERPLDPQNPVVYTVSQIEKLKIHSPTPDVSIIICCYNRHETLIRMLTTLLNQDFKGCLQILLIGDACSELTRLCNSYSFVVAHAAFVAKGHILDIFNFPRNNGYYGYYSLSLGIILAQGKYIMFGADDDYCELNHISNYFTHMETTEDNIALGILPSITYFSGPDIPVLRPAIYGCGATGHSEYIFRSKYAKQGALHDTSCIHDWNFCQSVLAINPRYKEFVDAIPTYQICRIHHGAHLPSRIRDQCNIHLCSTLSSNMEV